MERERERKGEREGERERERGERKYVCGYVCVCMYGGTSVPLQTAGFVIIIRCLI